MRISLSIFSFFFLKKIEKEYNMELMRTKKELIEELQEWKWRCQEMQQCIYEYQKMVAISVGRLHELNKKIEELEEKKCTPIED